MPSRKILKIQVLWGVIWCNLGAWINWQMPGFHIKQEIMEYLTNAASCGCGQKQQQRNDLTGDTLVANISEILVELMSKEIRNLDVLSFWRKIRESPLLHQWVCLCKHASGHKSAASRSVFIVERTYVFTQSRQLHTADGRRSTWWVFLLKRWDLWICLEIVSGQVQ